MAARMKSRLEDDVLAIGLASLRLQGPPEDLPNPRRLGLGACVRSTQTGDDNRYETPTAGKSGRRVIILNQQLNQAALASALPSLASAGAAPRRGLFARFCSIWRTASVSEILFTEEISRDMRS